MRVFAMGRPMVMAAPARTRDVVDQTVVSVGPYMLCSSAAGPSTESSSAASASGIASPPSITVRSDGSTARVSGSASSMRAIDGVHCRWVTPWRRISSARPSSVAGAGRTGAGAASPLQRARSSSSGTRLASTSSSATPKSMRHAISFTPASRSFSTSARQLSGVPKSPLVVK